MKIKLLFLFIISIINPLFSAPVDTATAKLTGYNFIQNLQSDFPAGSQLELSFLSSATTRGNEVVSYYYIFNTGNSGFVIVAADDRVMPVLGWSTENAFNPDEIPENVAAYLECYRQQIAYIIEHNLSSNNTIEQEWRHLLSGSINRTHSTRAVSPLLSTTWNQNPYYNTLCPVDTDAYSGRVPAGCVAIAMAQILRYWQYPTNGTGSHSYYANNSSAGYGNYGYQSANFSTADYQYGLMPVSLNSSSTSTAVNAVAKLCYHCGVAVEMMYGPSGSGAYSLGANPSAEYALINYFNYPETEGLYRYAYTDNNWIAAIKAQLDEERPVYYAASGDDGGHAFICDGYNSSNYFHFNWGWGGSYNGYYLMSSLNPGSYLFNQNHRAIVNIYPPFSITATPSSLAFFGSSGSASSSQSVIVSASNLSLPISVSTSSPFQVSSDNNIWGTITSLDTAGGTLYIRYFPTSSGTHSGVVQLICGGSLLETITLFGNACGSVTIFPWTEGFEEGTIPSCWHEVQESGTLSWTYRNGGNTYPATAHAGSFNAYFYAPDNNGNTTKLLTPELNLTGMTNPQMTFWHTQKVWGSDQDILNVYYRTTPGGAWTLLQSYTANIQNWTLETLNLPNPSSTYFIAFEGIANYGYGIALDDITILNNNTIYSITSVAGSGGTITPAGANNVLSGTNLTFTILADSLYSISDVLVDSVSIGAVTQYTFTNVNSNHTIEAIFELIPVPVIIADMENLYFQTIPGTPSNPQVISVSGVDLATEISVFTTAPFQVLSGETWGTSTSLPESGGMLFIRYNPTNSGNHSKNLILNSPGAPSVIISLSGNTTVPVYTITAYNSAGGAISPEGISEVYADSSITYTITPDEGYNILLVLIDGEDNGDLTSYTFEQINANHIIYAIFEQNVPIKENELYSDFTIFPNPTTEIITISISQNINENRKICITDVMGKKIKDFYSNENEIKINMGDLPDGLYFITLESKYHFLTKKIIKQ